MDCDQMVAVRRCLAKAESLRSRAVDSGRITSHGAILGGMKGGISVTEHLRKLGRFERAANRLEAWAQRNLECDDK